MKLILSTLLVACVADLVTADFDNDVRPKELCAEKSEGCWRDSDCCPGMECLGVFNWECGHTPARQGDYCNHIYYCEADLACHHGKCEDYKNILNKGKKGTCRSGSEDNKFKMMTYNVFLLRCPFHVSFGPIKIDTAIGPMKCQDEENRGRRVGMMGEYFKDRDEDVVVMQEAFTYEDELIEVMAAAGFCHYIMNIYGEHGSGLAIFSKWPIEDQDFIDWVDLVGPGEHPAWLDVESAMFDKGVMYAKIKKNEKYYHVYNTHTQSDSVGDGHKIRMDQYKMIREFVKSKSIPEDELIMLGGDFNEDFWHNWKENDPTSNKAYHEMIQELDADIDPNVLPVKDNGTTNTQNTEKNKLLKNLWKGDEQWETYKQLLDYIFILKNSKNGKQISVDAASFCEILIPQVPKGCNEAECMVSDHFPNTCTFYTNGAGDRTDEL